MCLCVLLAQLLESLDQIELGVRVSGLHGETFERRQCKYHLHNVGIVRQILGKEGIELGVAHLAGETEVGEGGDRHPGF